MGRDGTGGTGEGRGRRAAATLAVLLALGATLLAAVPTLRLYTPAPLDRTDAEVVADALPRLRYLRSALDDGAGERMQGLFPEGYYFTSVLYGIAWVDVGARDAARRPEALREARWALDRLDSPAGRASFSPVGALPYGVFHAGWACWLRAGVLRLAGGADADPATAGRLTADVQALAAAFDASPTPFLQAYPGQAWPVDSVVAVAALALHDAVLREAGQPARHIATLARWAAAARARTDPATGLLPHRVDPRSGRPLEGARATSQVVLLRFLADVDPVWSARDHRRFRTLFASTVPGVPGVREHPRGSDLGGDVDSGPIVLGLSASASTVELGTAVVHGDRETARALAGLAETTGAPLRWRGQKRYALGLLPVGDAFLAWAVTARRWVSPVPSVVHASAAVPRWWRLPWHLATLSLLVPVWTVALLLTARARRPGGPGPARDPSARSGSRCARWRCRWSAGSGQPGGSACSSWVRRGAIRP